MTAGSNRKPAMAASRSGSRSRTDAAFLNEISEPENRRLPDAAAIGRRLQYAGQRLWVMLEAGLSLVVMSGNYNSPASWASPLRIWREIVLANLTGSEPG
jgi:hypothetical protein